MASPRSPLDPTSGPVASPGLELPGPPQPLKAEKGPEKKKKKKLKGSFKGDIGPYKDSTGLYWKYLGL